LALRQVLWVTDSGWTALDAYSVEKECKFAILCKVCVMQKGSTKVMSKTPPINSGRKKDSDNISAPCSYWPMAHITKTIIATQI